MNTDFRSYDLVDFALIKLLEADGRLTNAALGRSVMLGEGAVRRRVSRLVDDGALRIIGVSSAGIHGLNVHAMVSLHVHLSNVPKVVAELFPMPEIRFIYETTGSFNVIAVGFFEDNEAFHLFVGEKLAPLPGIVGMETQLILKTGKLNYGHAGGAVFAPPKPLVQTGNPDDVV